MDDKVDLSQYLDSKSMENYFADETISFKESENVRALNERRKKRISSAVPYVQTSHSPHSHSASRYRHPLHGGLGVNGRNSSTSPLSSQTLFDQDSHHLRSPKTTPQRGPRASKEEETVTATPSPPPPSNILNTTTKKKSQSQTQPSSNDSFISMLQTIEQRYADLPRVVKIRVERWISKLAYHVDNATWIKERNMFTAALLHAVTTKSFREVTLSLYFYSFVYSFVYFIFYMIFLFSSYPPLPPLARGIY
jgi:hypothetical protein